MIITVDGLEYEAIFSCVGKPLGYCDFIMLHEGIVIKKIDMAKTNTIQIGTLINVVNEYTNKRSNNL